MFIYNLRFLFLLGGLFYLLLFWVFEARLTHEVLSSFYVLTAAWVVSAGTTIALHARFRGKLNRWAKTLALNNFPRLFDSYFLIDFAALVLIVVAARVWTLPLYAFSFLIVANLVIYAAYARLAGRTRPFVVVGFYVQLILCLILLPLTRKSASSESWAFLYAAPLGAMFIVALWSVMMISWLRSIEHRATERRLRLLGEFEGMLSQKLRDTPLESRKRLKAHPNPQELLYKQIESVLTVLCSLGEPFWYGSAMVWFRERHLHPDDEVLVGGPSFPRSLARSFESEMSITGAGLVASQKQAILHSAKYQADDWEVKAVGLDPTLDVPAAFQPLERRIGTLVIYGAEGTDPPFPQDSSFLNSCGSILSSAIEQWETWYGESALQEMDELFDCAELPSVWPKAAKLMKKYLGASGCMIIFRPDPTANDMHIIAKEGFSDAIFNYNLYRVGVGQTGECAAKGEPIRWDNVPRNRDKFDPDLLDGIERALGENVRSWLAIPIGERHNNYGVIKVVNREFTRTWFSDQDQRLGTALALRLRVIIERFLDIDRAKEAAKKASDTAQAAKTISEEAKRDKEVAVQTARQRQQDMMVMTHQLQSPLIAISAALSFLLTHSLSPDVRVDIDHTRALTEDAILISYATSTCLALAGGRDQLFAAEEIDTAKEMRQLCERLKRTNARKDLNFAYRKDPEFPRLLINREIFTSVLFGLIHNAIKYADQHSEVTLECGFEIRGTAALKVKSFGEPIHPSETELIFEIFRRGREIERTGRHHGGVGLGLFVGRTLMRAIGGDLTVELSDSDRRRSIFIMHFPG